MWKFLKPPRRQRSRGRELLEAEYHLEQARRLVNGLLFPVDGENAPFDPELVATAEAVNRAANGVRLIVRSRTGLRNVIALVSPR